MTNYRETLRLFSLGIHKQDIAKACGCSRNTVAHVLKKAQKMKIGWEIAQRLTERELAERLFPQRGPKYKIPDYEYIHDKMAKRDVTLSFLWRKYCLQCRQSKEKAYSRTQFINNYSKYVQKLSTVLRTSNKPGEIMETFWLEYILTDKLNTLQPRKAYILVSVLPYSGYMYAKAFPRLDNKTWVTAHIDSYEHFGGVPRMLLRNNPTKNISYEICREFAEYYKTAIIPVIVPSLKNTVGVDTCTEFVAILQKQVFSSVCELNEAISFKLEEFNRKQSQETQSSRIAVFEEEHRFLLPFPKEQFKSSEENVDIPDSRQ